LFHGATIIEKSCENDRKSLTNENVKQCKKYIMYYFNLYDKFCFVSTINYYKYYDEKFKYGLLIKHG
jgi:hypothetical protein